MNRKYKITEEIHEVRGHILHRIQAVRDFGDVKAGELGGFVEKESNLSHEGTCWIYRTLSSDGKDLSACVFEDAQILQDAEVVGTAQVFGSAKVFGCASVSGKGCQVFGNASIFGSAGVGPGCCVKDSARISGAAEIFDLEVSGNSCISGRVNLSGESAPESPEVAKKYGKASKVSGNAKVSGNLRIRGFLHISGDSKVSGKGWVEELGDFVCTGSSEISGRPDFKYHGCYVFEDAQICGDLYLA